MGEIAKPVRLDAEAKAEIASAVKWYEQQREGLGRDFMLSVRETLELLEQVPGVGTAVARVSPDLGVRKVLVRRFPYAVVLLELEDEIRVLAVAHGKREPGYWSTRI